MHKKFKYRIIIKINEEDMQNSVFLIKYITYKSRN